MTDLPHPVLHLPPEILQEIFTQCAHADKNGEGYNTANTKKAPLALSHTCRSWRQSTLNTPKLWCHLHLDWTTRKRWSPSLIGHLWLSRCGAIPIHLSIRERQDGYFQFKDSGTHFALGYPSQISSLSLAYDTAFHVEGLPSEDEVLLQNLRFPLLRRLELRGWSFNLLASLIDLTRCPQLRRYRLDTLHSWDDLTGQFKGITSLSGILTHLDIHEILLKEDDLSIIPNILPLLSTLGVTVEIEIESDSQQQRSIIFTNLRRMKLTLSGEENIVDDNGDPIMPPLIFNRLFAPSLVALETDCDNGPLIPQGNYHVANAVYEFIHRSQCSLQELSISGWEYDDSLNGTRILELACSIPSLRKLSYDGMLDCSGYCSENSSVHHLHEPTDDHPLIRVKESRWELLPLLEELHCSINPNIGETALSETINAIDRRMKIPNGLKCCRISFANCLGLNISETDLATLTSLTKLGLVYTVGSLGSPKDEGAASLIGMSGARQPYLIDQEDWAAYP